MSIDADPTAIGDAGGLDAGIVIDALLAIDRSQWSPARRQGELLALRRLTDRLTGVTAQLIAELDTSTPCVRSEDCDTSVAGWLRDQQRLPIGVASGQVRAALQLAELPLIRAALQDGLILPAHADVIRRLIGKVDAGQLTAAQPALLDLAFTYDPHQLRQAIRVWLAEHCPDLFDADEDRAAENGWLQIDALGDGRHKIHGHLPTSQTETLLTALAGLTPRRGDDDRRTLRQRRADALIDLADQALRSGQLPETGGLPSQVSVVITTDHLAGTGTGMGKGTGMGMGKGTGMATAIGTGLGPATGIGTGMPSPPWQRCGRAAHTGPLASWFTDMVTCDADLTPVYLSQGQVIALGRTTRVVNRAQRRALNARDQGCTARGCTHPTGACDAHHLTAWQDGGRTDLDNLVLLCRHHHRQWHRGRIGRANLRISWLPHQPL